MTLRGRALSEEEAHRLARVGRSQKLGAGLVRRARIIRHAAEGLSAPGIAAAAKRLARERQPAGVFATVKCSREPAIRQPCGSDEAAGAILLHCSPTAQGGPIRRRPRRRASRGRR